MRRAEKEIKDRAEIERILREAEVGRLGTCADGRPYVVPVNFSYHEGVIVFHSARRGKKLENIARNPRVCFEVDEGEVVPAETPCKYSTRYRSVVAHGAARIVTDPRRMLEDLRLLMDKYAPEGVSRQLTLEMMRGHRNLAVVEITVTEMRGKRSPA